MRYLVCLFGGLLLGGLLALTVSNSLQRRTAYPRGVMNVMEHQLGVARDAARSGQCAAPVARGASAHLGLLAGDIQAAILPAGTDDRVFAKYLDDLHAAIDRAAAAGSDCKAAGEAWTAVSGACDACHRDYR